MEGVRRLDPLAGEERRAPCSWDDGTVYHVFDGGYLWNTPFDNHEEAVHRVSSVGFCLDARRFRPGTHAETEFRGLLARVPWAARQLADAQPVQPFHRATVQDTVEHAAGARWCLLPESGTGVDGLFSRSLTCGLELVDTLAHRILSAVRTGEWTAADFAPADRLSRGRARAGDAVHRMFLDATIDHGLFVAVLKLLSLGTMLGTFRLAACLQEVDGEAPGDVLTPHETAEWPGTYFAGHGGYRDLLERAADLCTAARVGCVEPKTASYRIFDSIERCGFAPLPFGFADPTARFYHPSPDDVADVLAWSEKAEDAQVAGLVRNTLLAVSRRHG
jgi:FADH2 O2-dependent halogenase